jgi:hypothetical protein
MFKLIKRLLIAATIILTISVPSAAYARFFEYGPSLRSSTSQQAQPAIARLSAAKLRQLEQLQPSVAQQFASEGENDDLRWPHRDGLIWPHFSSVVVGLDVA